MEQNENPLEGEQTNENNNHQEEMQPPITTMESLLAQEDLGLDFPKSGEIRTGIIVSISDEEILVSVGTKSEGVIPKKELEMIQPEDREKFEVGQDVTVYVINPEDTQGNLMLSHTRALEENDWQKAKSCLNLARYLKVQSRAITKAG
jgi:ribosomal protein S1